jgi:hypothetical protein
MKIYKCFIASPSDTHIERNACDEVFQEINKSLGDHHRFRIESVKWETDSRPDVGKDGQDVINKQLLSEDPHIFIGMMWGKFGSPTPRHASGTVEEFVQVLEKWEQNRSIKILWYFNNAAIPLDDIDPEQLQKVKDFKRVVSEKGCLYHSYNGIDDFKTRVRQHITQHLLSDETHKPSSSETNKQEENDFINNELEKRLKDALRVFGNDNITWIDRSLCETESASEPYREKLAEIKSVADIIDLNDSIIIKAAPQFGLTCLSHYMVKAAWDKGLAWVYIDFDNVKISKIDILIQEELGCFNRKIADCLLIDSWNPRKTASKKILEDLHKSHPNTRMIIMHSESNIIDLFDLGKIKISRDFKSFSLLALTKHDIRSAINIYKPKIVSDETTILNKLILDISALNIHRTPMNCWTLLKVSERNFDTSPVNRTQMLEMVLFILFNLNEIPSYKTLPDAKDCEHVLGYYCEKLIRDSELSFTRDNFFEETKSFCKDKLIAIEVNVLFDILERNRIIVPISAQQYRFKASFWVYYFAAKRMNNDENFRNYILSDQNCALSSEIIEFYTGISRNKTDVLTLLRKAIASTRNILDKKIGFDGTFNPLNFISWNPSEKDIDTLKEVLNDEIQNSNIPVEIKDQHSDKSYNQLKPYNQDINKFLRDASFPLFLNQLEALSKALRNSDYADSSERKLCLKEVVDGWLEISKILFALTPILAKQGFASFEGHGFHLSEDFKTDENIEKLFIQILCANPENVVRYQKEYLSSDRMGPLIYDFLDSKPNPLAKHLIALYLVSERPDGWNVAINNYIISLDINSFYLRDLLGSLRNEYKYGYAEQYDEGNLITCIKKCIAKHELSLKNPMGHALKQVSNKCLPKKME